MSGVLLLRCSITTSVAQRRVLPDPLTTIPAARHGDESSERAVDEIRRQSGGVLNQEQ